MLNGGRAWVVGAALEWRTFALCVCVCLHCSCVWLESRSWLLGAVQLSFKVDDFPALMEKALRAKVRSPVLRSWGFWLSVCLR